MRAHTPLVLLALLVGCQFDDACPDGQVEVEGACVPDRDDPDTDDTEIDDAEVDDTEVDDTEVDDTDDTDVLEQDTDDNDDTDDTDPSGGAPTDSADTDAAPMPTADTGITPPPCATLTSWTPANQATGVATGDPIRATFDRVDPISALVVSIPGQGAIAGTQRWNGTDLVFTPASPLQPATAYYAAATWSCGNDAVSFTTAAPAGPAQSVASLANRTWALDLNTATWVQPAGVGSLLAGFLAVDPLLGVRGGTGGNIDLRIGVSDTTGTAQDTDFQTYDATASYGTNPRFRATVGSIALNLGGGVSATLDNVVLAGEFGPGGTTVSDVSIQGSVDTRPLGPALGLGTSPGAICNLVAASNLSCQACPQGGGNFCLGANLQDIDGTELSNVTLLPVATTAPGASCSTAGAGALGSLGLLALLTLRRRRD